MTVTFCVSPPRSPPCSSGSSDSTSSQRRVTSRWSHRGSFASQTGLFWAGSHRPPSKQPFLLTIGLTILWMVSALSWTMALQLNGYTQSAVRKLQFTCSIHRHQALGRHDDNRHRVTRPSRLRNPLYGGCRRENLQNHSNPQSTKVHC